MAAPFQLYARARAERERLQHSFEPQLIAEAPQLASSHIAFAPDRSQTPVTYVRVPIRNVSTGIAHKCSAGALSKREILPTNRSRVKIRRS